MKKIFTLIAIAMMAIGAQAQTATSSYLSIDRYATIDDAGIKGVLEGGKLYSYDATQKVLVVSAFVGYQSSTSNDGGSQAWISYTASGSTNVDAWAATDVFKGSAYYQMANSGALTHRAAAVKSTNTYKYRVSNCKKVSFLASTGGSNRTVTMNVYEVVDGTPSTTATGTAAVTVNSLTVASVESLDASKVYEVTFTNESTNNSRLFEIAFYEGDVPAGINAIETSATAAPAVQKYVENGKLVIEKGGKKFNAAGAQLK